MENQTKPCMEDRDAREDEDLLSNFDEAFSDWLYEECGGLPIVIHSDGRVTCGSLRRFTPLED